MKHLARFSFCPACASGTIDVYEKNGVRCSACGYVYFHNCASSVAAIVEIGDTILLIRRTQEPCAGALVFPGGFVDYHEPLETALVREVKEECGIDITGLRYFGSFPNTYRYRDVTYHTVDAFFLCTAAGIPAMCLSDENGETVLARLETIDEETIAFDSMKQALAAYRRTRGSSPGR
ncbi:MAG: NUDIX domain-containing protein [Chitinispirillaceae bacterium]|nr:NUDIX domain-containing protein [Chitinispirillaceae bacterium]